MNSFSLIPFTLLKNRPLELFPVAMDAEPNPMTAGSGPKLLQLFPGVGVTKEVGKPLDRFLGAGDAEPSATTGGSRWEVLDLSLAIGVAEVPRPLDLLPTARDALKPPELSRVAGSLEVLHGHEDCVRDLAQVQVNYEDAALQDTGPQRSDSRSGFAICRSNLQSKSTTVRKGVPGTSGQGHSEEVISTMRNGFNNQSVELPRETDRVSLADQTLCEGVEEMQEGTPTFVVKFPEGKGRFPLADQTVRKEVEEILGTMLGKEKYLALKKAQSPILDDLLSSLPKSLRNLQEKMKEEMDKIYFPLRLKLQKTGSPILPGLQSILCEALKELQENNHCEVALEEVKNETSKWVYLYMRKEGNKVVEHPQHIRDIPRDWRIDHPRSSQTFYPPDIFLDSMKTYTGLDTNQVDYLLANDRKRRAGQDPLMIQGLLKRHCTKKAQEKLREWQTSNPGQKQPDKASRKALSETTGMDENKIKNWFANHAPGRENRNRSKETTLP